jgi:hypothetical protein
MPRNNARQNCNACAFVVGNKCRNKLNRKLTKPWQINKSENEQKSIAGFIQEKHWNRGMN